MKKIKTKGGRPRIDNPRTVISEVYLTPDEAEELRCAGKTFGYAYLSQFLRTAAFALIRQKSIGLDAKSACVAAHLGAIASDVNALHHLASDPSMPEAAFIISGSLKKKLVDLNKLIQQQ